MMSYHFPFLSISADHHSIRLTAVLLEKNPMAKSAAGKERDARRWGVADRSLPTVIDLRGRTQTAEGLRGPETLRTAPPSDRASA
jgi:hypothetical protein